jgi:hypothetical protein
MAAARDQQTATLLKDGRVLILGGDSGGHELPSSELYDPVAGSFALAGSMNTARDHHTATLLSDGRVLIVGGAHAGTILRSAELYQP